MVVLKELICMFLLWLILHTSYLHMISSQNVKKIPISLCFSFGNLKIGVSFILALHQWERFSMDESYLTRNTI